MIRSPLFVIPPGTRAVIAHLNSPICFRLYMLYVINSSPYDLLLQSLISSSISMPIGLSNWPSSSSVFELFVLRVYDIICPYTKHKSHPLSYIRCLLLSLSLSLRFIHSYHCCFDFISDQYNCSILFVLSVFYIFLAASTLIIPSAIAFRVHDEISLITFRNYIILSRHLLYLSRSLFLSLSLCSPIRKVQINFCFPIITHRFIAHTYIDIQQHIDI